MRESHKLVVLVGTISVGKKTMIDYILKQFLDSYSKPEFRSTVRNEDGYKLIDIEEHSNRLNNNLFIYDILDNKKTIYLR